MHRIAASYGMILKCPVTVVCKKNGEKQFLWVQEHCFSSGRDHDLVHVSMDTAQARGSAELCLLQVLIVLFR